MNSAKQCQVAGAAGALQRGLIRVRHGATTPPRCLLLHPLPRIRVQTSDRTNPCSPRSLNNPQQPPAASSAAYGPPLVGATHPLPTPSLFIRRRRFLRRKHPAPQSATASAATSQGLPPPHLAGDGRASGGAAPAGRL